MFGNLLLEALVFSALAQIEAHLNAVSKAQWEAYEAASPEAQECWDMLGDQEDLDYEREQVINWTQLWAFPDDMIERCERIAFPDRFPEEKAA